MKRNFDEMKEKLSGSASDIPNETDTSTLGVSDERIKTQEAISEMIEDSDYLERQKKKEQRKKNMYKVGLIVAIIIIIILLLKSCSIEKSLTKNTVVPELETSALVEQNIPEETNEKPRIDIPVIQNFIVSKEYPYKDLYNPESNKGKYYLQFSFTIDGENEPFYQSKLVEGGYKFSVNFGELLDVGEYDVNVTTNTFTEGSLEQKSGDMHMIKITVTE